MEERRETEFHCRFKGSSNVRRGKKNSPEDNDCKRYTCRTYPHHVQPRNRRRRHETHCSSDGRRRHYLNNPRTRYLSCNLYAVEGEEIQELNASLIISL